MKSIKISVPYNNRHLLSVACNLSIDFNISCQLLASDIEDLISFGFLSSCYNQIQRNHPYLYELFIFMLRGKREG